MNSLIDYLREEYAFTLDNGREDKMEKRTKRRISRYKIHEYRFTRKAVGYLLDQVQGDEERASEVLQFAVDNAGFFARGFPGRRQYSMNEALCVLADFVGRFSAVSTEDAWTELVEKPSMSIDLQSLVSDGVLKNDDAQDLFREMFFS